MPINMYLNCFSTVRKFVEATMMTDEPCAQFVLIKLTPKCSLVHEMPRALFFIKISLRGRVQTKITACDFSFVSYECQFKFRGLSFSWLHNKTISKKALE